MPKYAQRVEKVKVPSAAIHKLFKAMSNPNVISFGGGAPAKEALPVEIVREIAKDVFTRESRGIEALQYGKQMGINDLREAVIRELLQPKGVETKIDNVMIVNGGLEAIYLVCQLFIEPGDIILVESPTFAHALETFAMFEAGCVPCKMTDNGLDVQDVEEKIKKLNPKMVYTIPTFQNPTGRTLSLDSRKKLAELGSQYDVIVLEDDPYRDIRYSGTDLLPIKAFDKTGHTVMANSFSKIFSPGSRLGYVVASESIIGNMCNAHSATISHTGVISQVIAAEFLNRGYFKDHLQDICNIYRERRDTMISCLDKYFPSTVKYTYPDGGLFTWVELPEEINASSLLDEAMREAKVAYVAGESFFVQEDGSGRNCMRLSFGSVEPEQIEIGMKKLGGLINAKLARL